MRLHVHDNAIAIEAHLRVFGVRVAGGTGLALEVVASVLREELLVQRALERLRGDVEFNGFCGAGEQ